MGKRRRAVSVHKKIAQGMAMAATRYCTTVLIPLWCKVRGFSVMEVVAFFFEVPLCWVLIMEIQPIIQGNIILMRGQLCWCSMLRVVVFSSVFVSAAAEEANYTKKYRCSGVHCQIAVFSIILMNDTSKTFVVADRSERSMLVACVYIAAK